MNNAKLEAIRDEAAEKLRAMFTEAIPEIEAAIADVASEAQAQEQEAKFRVSFTMTYNLDRSRMSYRLGFGVRRNWDAENEAPDPNQPKLLMS